MTPLLSRQPKAKSQNRSSFFCAAAKVKNPILLSIKRNPFASRGVHGGSPRPKIVFLTCKNLCFCAGDAIVAENLRYREFPAISTQPKTTKPKHVLEATPQQPQFSQCHSPSRFLKQKSVCFHMSSSSRIKPEAQGSGTPKNTKPKTRVGGDSHSPTPTNVTALPVF